MAYLPPITQTDVGGQILYLAYSSTSRHGMECCYLDGVQLFVYMVDSPLVGRFWPTSGGLKLSRECTQDY